MTIDKKNKFESTLSYKEKEELKYLLCDISDSIKENKIPNNNEVDNKLGSLASKIDSLKTQKQADTLLDYVKNELQALENKSDYKDLVEKLEGKVDKFQKQVKKTTNHELQQLKKNIGVGGKNNLTPDKICEEANKGRQNAKTKVASIVYDLAKKGGFLGKLAQLANGGDSTKNV